MLFWVTLNGEKWLKPIKPLLKRVCITGPESTGKSWLTKKLAEHYKTISVPEYSVEYLTKFGAAYKQSDILAIAKGQIELEEKIAKNADDVLFCDTSFLFVKSGAR